MSLSSASNATPYSFQNRIYNADAEAMDTIVFEFASIANVAAILGMAFSIGGSGNNPAGAWQRVTFGGGNAGAQLPNGGSTGTPAFLSSDAISIPGGWAPNASMLVRIAWASGAYPTPQRIIASEINWPANNTRSSGDYASTDDLLAQNPTWSGSTYNPSWHKIRVRRVNAKPAILTHGDSVWSMIRGSDTSGYGWCWRLNGATESYHVATYGQGGITLPVIADRHADILGKYGEDYTHTFTPGWSGNSPPTDAAGIAATKALVEAMEAQTVAAGKIFCVGFIKPTGSDGTDPLKLAAFNELRVWAAAKYGIHCLDVSQDPTLVGPDGYTMLNSPDQAHYNNEGQRLQALALAPKIEAMLIADGYTL